jgi:hypothetical protein
VDRRIRTDFRFHLSARLTNVFSLFLNSLFNDVISIETIWRQIIVRLMNIEQFMEWKLVGETGVCGHSAPCNIFSTTNPEWPDLGANPGRSGWKPTPIRPIHSSPHQHILVV